MKDFGKCCLSTTYPVSVTSKSFYQTHITVSSEAGTDG